MASDDQPIKTFANSRDSDVAPGKWCAGFSACKKYATDHNVPLITVWVTNETCSYCKRFALAAMSETFKTWMKDTGYVFWAGCKYCTGEDGENGAGQSWCPSSGTLPRCRVYWAPNGNAKVNKYLDGNTLGNVTWISDETEQVKVQSNRIINAL